MTAKDKDVLAFRKKVYADLTEICKMMNDILELNRAYSEEYYEHDSDAFFNEYLPVDKDYPFEKSFDDQLYALQNWREKIGELIKVSEKEGRM